MRNGAKMIIFIMWTIPESVLKIWSERVRRLARVDERVCGPGVSRRTEWEMRVLMWGRTRALFVRFWKRFIGAHTGSGIINTNTHTQPTRPAAGRRTTDEFGKRNDKRIVVWRFLWIRTPRVSAFIGITIDETARGWVLIIISENIWLSSNWTSTQR